MGIEKRNLNSWGRKTFPFKNARTSMVARGFFSLDSTCQKCGKLFFDQYFLHVPLPWGVGLKPLKIARTSMIAREFKAI